MSEQLAQEHFNKAITSARTQTAIEEFDACLCQRPSPPLALMAYFHLARAINRQYGFEHREDEWISDEEFSWRLQEVYCMSKVFDLYDEIPDAQKNSQINDARSEAQNFFDDVSYTEYGLTWPEVDGEQQTRDLNEVLEIIRPLKCLSGQDLIIPVQLQALERQQNLAPMREAGRVMDREREVYRTLDALIGAYDNERIRVLEISEGVAKALKDDGFKKVATYGLADPKVIDEARQLAARKDAMLAIIREDDSFDLYLVQEGAKKSGGCFIATAVYGTPLASEIFVLRRFRDEVLLESPIGVWAVNSYYRVSPPIAELISKSRALRAVVKHVLLEPILRILHIYDFRKLRR